VIEHLPTALTLIAFVLHVLGERRAEVLTGRPRNRAARTRALTFYAGLLTILVALQSPLDNLAEQLFWAHMIQHLLLLVVAAPLIVLGQPWMSLWRPFPLGFRRRAARVMLRSPSTEPVRAVCRVLSRPAGAWLAFNVNLVFWHLPGPYDLTLRDLDLHVLEHCTFLIFGVLFWAQVIGVRPARSPLPYTGRIGFLATAIVANVGLSMYLAFAQHPLYSPYALLAHRPGGISARADQQIGAGIMWAAGDLPFAVAIAVLVQRWLTQVEAMTAALVRAPPVPRGPSPNPDAGPSSAR
jgi:putative membrane protein